LENPVAHIPLTFLLMFPLMQALFVFVEDKARVTVTSHGDIAFSRFGAAKNYRRDDNTSTPDRISEFRGFKCNNPFISFIASRGGGGGGGGGFPIDPNNVA